MLYAVLCYKNEDEVCAWSQDRMDKVMSDLAAVQAGFAAKGKLGPSASLLPTTAATTLRKDSDPPLVIDGPFAETKEQLLGFFVLDADDLDDAVEMTRQLAKANPGGAFEIRPVGIYNPSQLGETYTSNIIVKERA
jgi:hypothetical protein